MQKNVGGIINLAQLLRVEESGQLHPVRDFEFAREFLQLGQHWAFTGNGQGCLGIMIQKRGERVQRGRDSFLLNKPACLKKTPSAIGRKLPFTKRKLLQRNPGTNNVDLTLVTSK